jgi:TPR repeat protein
VWSLSRPRAAARLYRSAANQDHANLEVFYNRGPGGLAKDEHEAARFFNLAANQGHASASGTPTDDEKRIASSLLILPGA